MTDGASISFETVGPSPQNRMIAARASAGPAPFEGVIDDVEAVSGLMVRETVVVETLRSELGSIQLRLAHVMEGS